MKRFTLCVIHHRKLILLALKLKGMGTGKLSFPGGKIEGNETDEMACVRESLQELSIEPCFPQARGVLRCSFVGSPEDLEIRVFSASRFNGTPQGSDELGMPSWFSALHPPYDKMWAADEHWLPALLRGQNFVGEFTYQNENTLLSQKVEVVERDGVC